jgi:hypothetical protein
MMMSFEKQVRKLAWRMVQARPYLAKIVPVGKSSFDRPKDI